MGLHGSDYEGYSLLWCDSSTVKIRHHVTNLCHITCNHIPGKCSLKIIISPSYPLPIHEGAGKSLAQPTSWCCRTESVVSLERGVCSCAELQVFSCYMFLLCLVQRLKRSMSGDTCYLNNIKTWAVNKFFFPVRQGAEGNSRHSERNIRGTCSIICHHQKLGGPI